MKDVWLGASFSFPFHRFWGGDWLGGAYLSTFVTSDNRGGTPVPIRWTLSLKEVLCHEQIVVVHLLPRHPETAASVAARWMPIVAG